MEKRQVRRFKQWNRTLIIPESTPDDADDSVGIEAFTFDISLDGARIRCAEALPVEAEVRMHIELAKSRQTIGVDAVVKWVKKHERDNFFEIGVAFMNTLPTSVFALMKNLYDESPGFATKATEDRFHN